MKDFKTRYPEYATVEEHIRQARLERSVAIAEWLSELVVSTGRGVQRQVNISRGQGQKDRRCAAISMRSSIATGRGTPTLPSSQRLTAGRLTPIAAARSAWVR